MLHTLDRLLFLGVLGPFSTTEQPEGFRSRWFWNVLDLFAGARGVEGAPAAPSGLTHAPRSKVAQVTSELADMAVPPPRFAASEPL